MPVWCQPAPGATAPQVSGFRCYLDTLIPGYMSIYPHAPKHPRHFPRVSVSPRPRVSRFSLLPRTTHSALISPLALK